MAGGAEPSWASRGALKLAHALDVFGLDPAGMRCADLGCHAGGFTDVLLRRGAARVHAVDTGYGVLDYRLRVDERVLVMERTNALHAAAPADAPLDLVVMDMGWTPQRLCVPAALRWIEGNPSGRVVTLIKPHYEAKGLGREASLSGGVLGEDEAQEISEAVYASVGGFGARGLGLTASPIEGGKGRGRSRGNREWLALLAPAASV